MEAIALTIVFAAAVVLAIVAVGYVGGSLIGAWTRHADSISRRRVRGR